MVAGENDGETGTRDARRVVVSGGEIGPWWTLVSNQRARSTMWRVPLLASSPRLVEVGLGVALVPIRFPLGFFLVER